MGKDEKAYWRRKRLGAYYTPLDLSRALSEWSIRSAGERVLEPGFGGCEFLFAAKERLQELGAKSGIKQLFGCDVDERAFEALKARFGVNQLNGRYLRRDFLSIRPTDYAVAGFDVVLGNPPYVSHHVMTNVQIEAGQLANREGSNANLSRRASLWAYFITHGVIFLRPGGRSAWILPISFLHADYAAPVRDYLSKWFSRVVAFRMTERMFTAHQVSEQSIILLCDGKHDAESKPVPIQIASVQNLEELRSALQVLQREKWQGSSFRHAYAETALSEECRGVIDEIQRKVAVQAIGSVVNVRIGLVTGANRFFIFSEKTAKAAGLPRKVLLPIITGAEDLLGSEVTSLDLDRACKQNMRCLFLDTSLTSHLPLPVRKYLRTYSVKLRKKNATFAKRDPWHKANDRKVPDGFFSYMSHLGPKMAINTARTNSVNAVHRVFKKDGISDTDLKLLGISVASTFTQLSAELCGRTYGDGVLKLELNELRKMQVIRPANGHPDDINAVFKQLDELLRNGNIQAARETADDFLLRDCAIHDQTRQVRVLSETLEKLRTTRTKRPKRAVGH